MSPRRRFSAIASCAACAASLGAAVFVPPVPSAFAAPLGAVRPPRHKEGDVLRVFDNANVVVITNEDPALVDALLLGTQPKEKRVLTVADWTQAEHQEGAGEVRVFLVNREKLPVSGLPAINAARRMPGGACSENDDLWAFGRRVNKGYDGHDSVEITLSAPDGAWLRQNVAEFRRWAELPNEPQKRPVSSVVVVPVGGRASEAANTLAIEREGNDARPRFHVVGLADWAAGTLRTGTSDEIVLIDRSETPSPSVAALMTGKTIGASDTVAWREPKNTDKTGRARWRIVFSAPNGTLLSEAAGRYPDPRRVPTTPLVVSTARDLRQVRRVAVAGVKNNMVGADMVKRLASRTATELRSLDAWEVPDRAGLSEILSEIALQQAGITQAKDLSHAKRDLARVQQLAAADALLIVEITNAEGGTEYQAQHERMTPHMSKPPRKPLEPSRLKFSLSLPGKEDDPTMRSISEALFSRAVGTKTDEEYQRDLDRYNDEVLPRWNQTLQSFQREKDSRTIEWRETVQSKARVTVTGSVRLVDLTDGLVLWEAPFSANDTEDRPEGVKTVTSRGEDSAPPTDGCPQPVAHAPDALTARCAEAAVAQAVRTIRTSALLPTPALVVEASPVSAAGAPAAVSGKLLDIDGSSFLIGLGQTDGVKVGDVLCIPLDNGNTARFIVTRARPRTCDAEWDKKSSAALLGRLTVGQLVTKETPPATTVAAASGERKTP